MSRLLATEARKAAASTTTWLLLGVTTLVGGLSTVLLVALADEEGAAMLADAKLQEAMHGASVGALLVVVAGCVAMAGDWRHGQAATTFLTEPRRSRVVLVRAVVYAAVGLLYGLAVSAAAVTAATIAYRADGTTFPFDRSAVWSTLAGVTASAVLLGMLGVAIGAVARSPVVGVVGALAWFFMVEPIMFEASTTVARWLPGMAATGLGRAPAEGMLAPGPAAVVLAAAVTAVLVAGTRLVERSDVTA
jgi:ABC-2 type transport system permease protein